MDILSAIFRPDHERCDGVRPINMYLLCVLFHLMGVFVASDAWSALPGHRGAWDPVAVAPAAVWASFGALVVLALLAPLHWLRIVLSVIFYKLVWPTGPNLRPLKTGAA